MISTRNYIILLLVLLFLNGIVFSQNIGIGTDTPLEKLDINGGLRIGNTSSTHTGVIRWNDIKNDFEGYNGAAWVSLTGGKGKWGQQASYATESSASFFTLHYADTPGSELGNAIAAKDGWVVVGAYRDAVPAFEDRWHAGSIRLMNRNGDQWTLKHTANDPDGKTSDLFGFSVGLSTSYVIGGAPYADLAGGSDQGKAHIYSYDQNGITFNATLLASDAQSLDGFGTATAIQDDVAVSSAPYNDIIGINNMGRVYIYTRSGTAWPQTHILTPSDGATDDAYGSAVALWGEYLAVSSPRKIFNGFSFAGKVYIYRKNAGNWTLIQQLNSPNPNNGERFGICLAMRNNILVVGGSDYGSSSQDGTGAVYIYEINGNTVTYQTSLLASDGLNGDAFGTSVDYLDDVLLVGAPNANIGANPKMGKTYVFKKINGVWMEEAILISSTNESGIKFGTAVGLTPEYGVVGAPFADLNGRPNNGQVFFFKQY